MKRILLFFLAGCMLLIINACTLQAASAPTCLEDINATETMSITETNPEAEPPTAATISVHETESTQPTECNALSVKICREDFPVYTGPSYDNRQSGIVGAAGIYTVLETVTDYEGNRWGKLESVDGWVDLSLNEAETLNMPLVTVSPADEEFLASGNYYYCKADTSEYACDIVFRAHDSVTHVYFFSMDLISENKQGPDLFYLPTWNPDMPFVASVSFPGDISAFGLEFTDSNRITRRYGITQSGRNGDICIYPLSPTPLPAEPTTWQYQIVKEDHSYRDSVGEVLIAHYYTYVEILSDSPIAKKINDTIKRDVAGFFMSDSDLRNSAQIVDPRYHFVCTKNSRVTYISENYLCINVSYSWYWGGVYNDDNTGFVFDLATGELATLRDFACGDTAGFEARLKEIVWEQIEPDYPWDDAYETLQGYTLDTFDYTILDGQIVLHFPEYVFFPGAYGPVTVYTGIYI